MVPAPAADALPRPVNPDHASADSRNGGTQLAEVAETLQPAVLLMAACAPAWTALRLTATQLFTLAVTGIVGLSALGIAIP